MSKIRPTWNRNAFFQIGQLDCSLNNEMLWNQQRSRFDRWGFSQVIYITQSALNGRFECFFSTKFTAYNTDTHINYLCHSLLPSSSPPSKLSLTLSPEVDLVYIYIHTFVRIIISVQAKLEVVRRKHIVHPTGFGAYSSTCCKDQTTVSSSWESISSHPPRSGCRHSTMPTTTNVLRDILPP